MSVPEERLCIPDLVMEDLAERKQLGIERYGTPLHPFNGRSALIDAYQEVLDLAQYLRQQIEEDRICAERLAAAEGRAEQWSREVPKVEGWYGWSGSVEDHAHTRMVWVEVGSRGPGVWFYRWHSVQQMAGWWTGPILLMPPAPARAMGEEGE